MRNLFLLSITLLLLLGCTGQSTTQANQSTQPNNSVNTSDLVYQRPPLPNTSGLYYYRNASDVVNTKTKFVPPPTYNFSNITDSDGRLIVYYFYSPHCVASVAIRPVINRLEAQYTSVDWREFDITTVNGSYAYVNFADQHNLSTKQRLVPQVLVNGTIITDRFHINDSLEGIIEGFQT